MLEHPDMCTHTLILRTMDTKILSEFPSDTQIKTAAKEAWEEADSLFTNLRVSPSEFMGPNSNAEGVWLPSISSWYARGQDPVLSRSVIDADEESTSSDEEMESEYDSDEEGIFEENADAVQLQTKIDTEEMNFTRSPEVDNKVLSLTCAAAAVEVNEIMFAYVNFICTLANSFLIISLQSEFSRFHSRRNY